MMALVTHFNLELYQIDVKIAFLNGGFEEEIYMALPEGLQVEGEGNILYKLKKSIYRLKHTSRQQYFKFKDTITFFGFKKNIVDQYIYLKVNDRRFISRFMAANFISGLGVVDNIVKPLKFYCDNFAAIFFSKNDRYYKGVKHMKLKNLIVKEEVQKLRESIEHINTGLIVADPLTKGLPPMTLEEHMERMSLGCSN